MSLFERIQNKRYNLQEAPIDDKGNITPEPGEVKKSEKILKKFNKKQKKIEQKNIRKNTQQGDKLLKDINKRKSADLTRADAINRSMGTSGSTEGAGGANTGTTPPKPKITGDVVTNKGVNQAEVSKKAQEFTKEVNKQRIVKQKNIFGGEDDVKPKKRRVGSTISRGTRTKTPAVRGQQKLNLGGDVTKKTPKLRLSKSGEVVKDLRSIPKKLKTRRGRSPLAKTPPPEKMVVAPDEVKGGFKKVGATTTQGRRIRKQSVSADELLGNQKKIEKKIVNNTKNTKNTPKPNLFSRIKSKIKGFHKFMVKDAGYRQTSGSGLMKPDDLGVLAKDRNITRNIYKNTLRGNTLKNINKVLPGKYKALAALALGTYALTRGKKDTGGGVVGGGPKVYTGVNPGLKLDKTGSKKK